MPFVHPLRTALLALVLVLPLAAFEGKVHFDLKTGSGRKANQQQIVYTIKGDKARMEMPDTPAGALIIDGAAQEMKMLMPEQKMYMVMSMEGAADMAAKAAPSSSATFEDTGETETILDRKARKYRITDRRNTTEVWATEGMGAFFAQLGGSKNPMKRGSLPDWQRELMGKGMFPLRVVVLDRKGKEEMRMEATKIEEAKVADADVSVPEGYQRFDMGGMLRGLIPGAK